MKDLYDIIGVSKSASATEIKKAYRKIAMKFHPDKNPDDKEAEKNFKEAAEAYAILSDPQKRSQYDQFGHAGVGMGGAQGRGFSGTHMSMDDIFSQFGDIFGDFNPFESIFGGGRSQSRRMRKASDLRATITLDFLEILNGVEKTIKLKRKEPCETCSGSGSKVGTGPSSCRQCGGAGQVRQATQSLFGQSVVVRECPVCRGTGQMIEHPCNSCRGEAVGKKAVDIKIKVPPGVASGNYMTLSGEGNKGGQGIHPGDLILYFEEDEDPYLVRDGEDVLLEAHLSFSQAALGMTMKVPTIEGEANLKIPAGIQSGQALRMKGKGFPAVHGPRRGNQLVRIQIDTPISINKSQKSIFEELDKLNGQTNPTFRKVK
ncbi:MAG: molecular chaperone DnaJ [Candidatus Marinimicrobia bacterium]|jgi:molecular chaperone DnaJ|nr:molecular chaperone DnaJ [Candidatus Neomarinimicrobiota bacterium]MBT3618125.1 molecular chaperone DnaJ [Candidatus Neomarinimicrobiota bacterium]MBT3828596.1 molecular chaperone DnaJ [Candidatus Neomarinimicrobiota bacterium]MBT3996942.1 molecular chaperone DnaJ [Candidatus Neomarinimicrobiota bacterium]MBT4280906.1 molecular chaperone DnaJ [Candidatus Neomarinimicrobiota bacterium]